jgi:phenylpyruvate tautomerase PptA (4-oxalocrotonate tautomerase family)
MPLLRFDLIEGRTDEELKALLDAAHRAMLAAFEVPERDRYQIVHEHEPTRIIIEDTGLDIPRTDKVVFLQVTSRLRKREQKEAFYRLLCEELERSCGHRAVRRRGVDRGEFRRGLVVRAGTWPVPHRRALAALVPAAAMGTAKADPRTVVVEIARRAVPTASVGNAAALIIVPSGGAFLSDRLRRLLLLDERGGIGRGRGGKARRKSDPGDDRKNDRSHHASSHALNESDGSDIGFPDPANDPALPISASPESA